MLLAIIDDAPGQEPALQINAAWLPTWLGFNLNMMEELTSKVLLPEAEKGVPLHGDASLATLKEIHVKLLDYICEKFDRPGLRKYLEALEGVEG